MYNQVTQKILVSVPELFKSNNWQLNQSVSFGSKFEAISCYVQKSWSKKKKYNQKLETDSPAQNIP